MEEGPIIFSGYDRLLRDYWQRNSPQASLVAGAGNAQSTMLLLELAVGTVDTTNKWTTTTGGTGTAAAIAASGDQTNSASLKMVTAAAADVSAITAKSLATNPLVSTSVNIYPKMVLEFMFSTDRVGNGSGTGPADASFIGLSNTDAALGTTNNIVGLRYTNSTGIWASVTDKAGTEEANNVLTSTAGTIYRVKIVLTNVSAQFSIDSGSGLAVVATHVTASSLPIVLLKPDFYFKQVGAAGTNYYIYAVRWYVSDEL